MESDDQQIQEMLTRARTAARELLERLRRQQAEIEASPPKLPPEQLEAGREALCKAIESAERTLASLDAAADLGKQE